MRQNGSIMEIFHNFFNNSENEIIFYDLSEERFSADNLRNMVEKTMAKLSSVERREYVILQIGDKKEFLISLISLFCLDAIPVILPMCTSQSGYEQLKKILKAHPGTLVIADNQGSQNLAHFTDGSINIQNIEADAMSLCRRGRAYGEQDEAIIMYSSGSTSEPKGTILTVENIIESVKEKSIEYSVAQNDVFMTWMSLEHIVGMVDFMFLPFFTGCTCVYSEISSFLSNPREWFDLMEKYNVTVSVAPNFAYKYMSDCITDSDNWDLSSLRILMSIGEPISRQVIQRFFSKVNRFHIDEEKFVAAYGLSETCSGVVVNKGNVLKAKVAPEVNITSGIDFDSSHFDYKKADLICQGEPIADTKVRIMDDHREELKENCIGNIEIKGSAVCKGYFEYDGRQPVEDGWLSTGDIGFYSGGALYVIGRRKDVIFSYGKNIYLSDLEYAVAKYFQLRSVACGDNVSSEGEFYIYLFVEINEAEGQQMKSKIRHTILRELGIKLDDIIFMDKLSNTKAGKISKAEIMRKYTMSRDSERRDNIEGFIKGYFAGEVTEDTSILDVAEDSLSMFRLIGAIHKQFGIKMGILDLTRCETIHDLCDYINKLSGREIPVEKITCENQMFCTSIQEAYILGRQQEFYGNTNMSHFYLEVRHNLSSQKIEEAIRKLIRRHSMLRSIFENSRRVVLGEDIADTFFLKTLEEKSLESHRKAANQKVNEPDKWPLFEICNIKEGDSYIAAIDIDMLIVDGFSLSVLVRDFKSLCRGLELEPISDGFGKYLEAYSIRKSGNRYLQDKQYWLERVKTLPGSPQIPILAAVNRGPNVFLRKEKAFTEQAWEELENVAERNGVTISVLLLTLYIHTLKRWSEEPEFTLNVTVMDRPTQMKDTERFVGDFTTNTLFNYENESGSPRNLYQDLSHVKGRLYEYLDHNNFDGVEVIREYAKVHQGEMALMPVVFTSMLFKEDNALTYEDINYFVTQTSQVYLDCQIYHYDTTYVIAWDYLEKVFPDNMIHNMFDYYMNLVEGIICGREINEIPVGNERAVTRYNETDYSEELMTIPEMLKRSLDFFGPKTAITDGETVLTYEQLKRRMEDMIEDYIKQGMKCGDTVMVLAGKDIDSVVAILAVAKIGATFIPVPEDYPKERIETIREYSSAEWIVHVQNNKIERCVSAKRQRNHTTSKLEDTAYIIFTSGSTGNPKGVAISHEGVMNTLVDMKKRFALDENEGVLGLSALNFDLSIFDIFGSIYMGGFLSLVKDPRNAEEINHMLEQFPITIWNSVPAIMKLFLESLPVDYRNTEINHIFLSGDWIGTELPEKIKKVFTNAEIISLGGATEASIWSIYFPIREVRKEWSSIPYGYPLGNQKIYILNKEGDACPTNVVGEICIGGRGVALGYVGDEEKTNRSFVDIPSIGRVYKTGDYGKFSEEGYVIILGRKDGQVKINGFRIELGEIEAVARKFYTVDNAIAIMDSKKKLALFYTGKEIEDRELQVHFEKYLPAYMIPYRFVYMEQFPLSKNGKIDRAALLQIRELKEESEISAPANEIEMKISVIWGKYLESDQVSVDENFFALGGDSIIAQRIAQELTKQFAVKIPFVKIVETGTVKELARFIQTETESKEEPKATLLSENQGEKTVEASQTELPMTNIQKAYFNGRNDSFELAHYNAHYYFEVEFPYEISDIERSIAQMLERHEVLRSIFLKNGTQKILADVPEYKVDITIAETEQEFAEKNEQMRRELSHKNYDFSKWPLFTFEVLKRGCDDFKILCASINLMVCDGDSLRIFLKEFTEGLNNKKLPPIHYSYHEYVNSLNDCTNEREYQEAKAYWLNKIPCFPEFPHLPMLKNLTQCKNYRISRVSETIDAETWGTFKNTVRKHAVSPSTVLCTIYARVLAKWSNQKDLLLNMTAFERKEFDQNVSGILGDFTKILPLEVHIDGADFWDNAMQIQTRILNNLDHKAFDGTEIIRELSRLRNGIGKALMPVVFTCVLFDSDENWFEQIGKLRYAVTQTPQVFLDNQILEMKHELYISWDYVEDLFNPAIIAAVFEDFISGIKNIAVNGVFETRSQIETDKVWDGYNMPVERVAPNTLQAFFEKQVRETPDGTALYYGDKQYTYAAIEAKANQVARYLCSHGICGANNRVGVLGERKPETIISIIGVLKTGAAYVPVDAKFPKERRDFILENSGSRLLLSEELYRSGELEQYDESPIGIQSLPDSLAYIIYTSGSTGKPKGVMINHMAACNTISDLNNKIKLNKTDRLIGISSVCFDLSVYDIFGAFSTGAALVMVRDARDCSEIVSLLAERKITVWNSVPVICSIVVQHMLERGMKDSLSLRQIMLSGDWIPLDLPDKAKSIFNKTKIMSLGGATEASIWSIYYEIGEVKPAWKSIPYGMPLKNQTMYVLNFAGELCPMDVVGEIYIGGVGVAQGYCGDTEKTEAAFIQHDHLGRIYKTGDMGVLRKEGYIEFLGRIDNQVKIRGYRIELGEIESAINNVPGIEKSVISYVVNRTGNKQLIAYYIPTSNDLASETIKESIGAFLPEYMVPQHYISIKELPLSANGKIDRSKLPELNLDKKERALSKDVISPLQKTLLGIWQKVFENTEITITDDFYGLGGDSIVLMKLLDEIALAGLENISIEDILEYETIEALSAYMEENK